MVPETLLDDVHGAGDMLMAGGWGGPGSVTSRPAIRKRAGEVGMWLVRRTA